MKTTKTRTAVLHTAAKSVMRNHRSQAFWGAVSRFFYSRGGSYDGSI